MTAANIIRGIAAKLRGVYPEDFYAIYTESVQQDLFRPCFFILLKSEERKNELGRRFRQKYRFNIIYYPSGNGGDNEEFIAVGQTLGHELRIIKAKGDLIRGKAVSCKADGGRLVFDIEYTLHLIEEAEEYEKMQEVSVYGKTGSYGK